MTWANQNQWPSNISSNVRRNGAISSENRCRNQGVRNENQTRKRKKKTSMWHRNIQQKNSKKMKASRKRAKAENEGIESSMAAACNNNGERKQQMA